MIRVEDLPPQPTLIKWLDTIKTALWRVLLRRSAQPHGLSTGEFRELVLMCAVHNIRQSLKPGNQAMSDDSPRPNQESSGSCDDWSQY